MERKEEGMNDYTKRSKAFYGRLNELTADLERLEQDLLRSEGGEPSAGEIEQRKDTWMDQIRGDEELAPLESQKLEKYITQGFAHLEDTRPMLGKEEQPPKIVPPEEAKPEEPSLEEAILAWKSTSDEAKLLEQQLEEVKGRKKTLMNFIAPQMKTITDGRLETDTHMFEFTEFVRKVPPAYKELFEITLRQVTDDVRRNIEMMKEQLTTQDVRRTIKILEKPRKEEDDEGLLARIASTISGGLSKLGDVLTRGAARLGDVVRRAKAATKSEKPTFTRKTTMPSVNDIGNLSWEEINRLVKQGKVAKHYITKQAKDSRTPVSDTITKMHPGGEFSVFDRHGELVTTVLNEGEASQRAKNLGGFFEPSTQKEVKLVTGSPKRGEPIQELEYDPKTRQYIPAPSDEQRKEAIRPVLHVRGYRLQETTKEDITDVLHRPIDYIIEKLPEGTYRVASPTGETLGIYNTLTGARRSISPEPTLPPVEEAEPVEALPVVGKEDDRPREVQYPFEDLSFKIDRLARDLKMQDIQYGPAGAVSAHLDTPGQVGVIEAELNKRGLMNDVGVIIEQGRINIYPLMLDKAAIQKDVKGAIAKIDEAMDELKKVWDQLSEEEKKVYESLSADKDYLLELLRDKTKKPKTAEEATFPSAGQYDPKKEPLRGLL